MWFESFQTLFNSQRGAANKVQFSSAQHEVGSRKLKMPQCQKLRGVKAMQIIGCPDKIPFFLFLLCHRPKHGDGDGGSSSFLT